MSKECDIVRDLIPLCTDGVCSKESEKLVLSHIADCRECAEIYGKITEEDKNPLLEETSGIIERQKRKMRRKSLIAGGVVGAILLVPVLICLIVNLATGHGLSWFFIVLASLSVAASLSVVPFVALNEKFLWTLLSFTVSLILLLLVCCLYTHGAWFFVAASSVLFGIALLILPFAANTEAAKKVFDGFRGLTVISVDILLLFAMLLCIGLYVKDALYYKVAFPLALGASVLAFAIFLIARYAKLPKFAKAGIFTALGGAVLYFAESVIGAMIGSTVPLPVPDFTLSPDGADGNIKCAILAVCILAGLIMFLFGIKKGRKTK